MGLEYLKVSVENRIATITLQRPPANALSQWMLRELSAVIDGLEKNDQARVILIHGEGRFFSAGADIKEFTSVNNMEDFSKLGKAGQDLFERMERFPKPILAAIHGAALGGGLELAMACHIRIVSENAKLGLPELQLGLVPGFGGSQRLLRYVGTAKAAEMLFTSEPISGAHAVELGLANMACPENEVLETAMTMAKKIAQKSPVALSAAIQLMNFSKPNSFYEGVNKEAELFGKVFVSNDAKEGIQAFLEKRTPNFNGN
jgi:enoyl-CoA hydratase